MISWARRPALAGATVLVVMVTTLVVLLGVGAIGDRPSRCERFASDARARAVAVTGSGSSVLVIGDSWSVGLGLEDAVDSWPTRLPGQVRVAGFSGSGFAEHASACAQVSFADRAPLALRGGADLVVVEGGLNDYDQPEADVRAGFARLMRTLRGHQVMVVGPAAAPSRASSVRQVDALLADLSAAYGVGYLATAALELPYLDDRLHLTAAGHRAFGDFVAAAVRERLATQR